METKAVILLLLSTAILLFCVLLVRNAELTTRMIVAWPVNVRKLCRCA